MYSEYKAIKVRKLELQSQLEEVSDNIHCLEQVVQIFQTTAKDMQEKVHIQLVSIVNHCLAIIFGTDFYRFGIDIEKKRGKTEAVIYLERDGVQFDPLSSVGGGVVEVVSFGIRLFCVVSSRPQLRQVMILDEPFAKLSSAYSERIAQLLEGLSHTMKIQFILVTHNESLKIGKVVQL